jgi:endoglucanase
MFQVIKDEGFDSIRLPVKWSAHADLEAPYEIDEKFFARVDWAVAHALTRGLKIVVDMHHYGNDGEEGMFDQPQKHHDRFLGLWKQIAEHYKDYPKELYLEILNEPRKALEPLWNAYMAEAVAVVRETNPGRTLIVGGGEWNKYYKLKDVVFPDTNIIATFHYYNPYCFTHQGQFWEPLCKTPDGSDPSKAGVAEWPVIWPKLDQNPDTTEANARAALEKDLRAAADWAKTANRPLYMGEFGASTSPTMEARADYSTSLVKLAQELGISWAYWQFASDMGIWNSRTMAFEPKMLDALKSSPDSSGTGGSGGSSSASVGGSGGVGGTTQGQGGSSSTAEGGASSTGGTTTTSS